MIFIIMGLLSREDWHLKRNKRNRLPFGKLTQIEGSIYLDEIALEWILQPSSRNLFHQPDKTQLRKFNKAFTEICYFCTKSSNIIYAD